MSKLPQRLNAYSDHYPKGHPMVSGSSVENSVAASQPNSRPDSVTDNGDDGYTYNANNGGKEYFSNQANAKQMIGVSDALAAIKAKQRGN